MKQKTRILIYILIGAAIVIAGMVIMFAKVAADKKLDVGRHIDLGQKYLIELSYDKAVLEFTEAIEIEPQNPDAYKGLALTYEEMGDTEQAIEWLRKGYDLTGDSSLKAEMDRINAYIQPAETTVTTTVTTTEATTTVTTEKMLTVPDLIGLSESDAVSACEAAEIPYAVLTEESDSVEKGFVVSQRIPASAKVKEGVELVFVVSEGKKVVTTAATTVTTTMTAVTTTAQTTKKDKSTAEYITINGEKYATDLTELDLSKQGLTNDDIKVLKKMTNLKKLVLRDNQISDISILTKLKKLEELDLSFNEISDISALSNLTNLEVLNLTSNIISDISALSKLTNLKELDLNNNSIDDISVLSKLKSLTFLGLCNTRTSDVDALSNVLSKLTNLKYLYLNSNQISDISSLSQLTSLESLYLWNNSISDISPLSKLTNLKDLDMSRNQISDISKLSKLTNLEWLNLSKNQISDKDIEKIKENLPNCAIKY